MTKPRRSYTQAEEVALTTQVESCCPLCRKPLFYVKNCKTQRGYELAHIFPLNPRPEEVTELSGVALLHEDVNHPDNLIPLCTHCHTVYDKPRTRDEYERLAAIKRDLIDRARQREINVIFTIESDIGHVISKLNDIHFDGEGALEFDVKSLDQKFDTSMPMLTRRKIRYDVTDYYQYVKREFKELELRTPRISDLIYTQVRAFYFKQRTLGLSQPVIFANIVEWLRSKTTPANLEAVEIVASFFVQNCEIFE